MIQCAMRTEFGNAVLCLSAVIWDVEFLLHCAVLPIPYLNGFSLLVQVLIVILHKHQHLIHEKNIHFELISAHMLEFIQGSLVQQ